MKAIIRINFEKINGFSVNKGLLKSTPQLFDVTFDTTKILCEQIERFFKDNKIIVTTDMVLEK